MTLNIPAVNAELSKPENKNDLKLILCNIRSMRENFSEFRGLLSLFQEPFDLIAVNETWLSQGEENAYQLEGYDIFCTPRNRHGGGVILYSAETLKASPIDALSHCASTFESVFLRIDTSFGPLKVGTIYRTPSKPLRKFLSEFESLIQPHLGPPDTIMCGDLNVNLLDRPTPITAEFVSTLTSLGLANAIHEPTRVTERTQTLLDQIWSSVPTVKNSFIIESPISDHYPVCCTVPIPKNSDSKLIKTRPLRPQHFESFLSEFKHLCDITYNSINTETSDSNNVDCVFENFISALKFLIEKHFPIKSKRYKLRALKTPWITEEMKSLIKKKYRIYSKCKRGLLPFSLYRQYRGMLNKALRISKRIYFQTQFSTKGLSSSEMWTIINKNLKPLKTTVNPKLKINGIITDDPKKTSAHCNNYYASSDSNQSHRNTIDPLTFLDPSIPRKLNGKSFFMHPVRSTEVANIILALKKDSMTSYIYQ